MKIAPNTQILNRIFASSGFKAFLENYKILFTAILAFAILACIAFLVLNITKLSTSHGNPNKRHEALVGLLVVSICLALLLTISVPFGIVFFLIGG